MFSFSRFLQQFQDNQGTSSRVAAFLENERTNLQGQLADSKHCDSFLPLVLKFIGIPLFTWLSVDGLYRIPFELFLPFKLILFKFVQAMSRRFSCS